MVDQSNEDSQRIETANKIARRIVGEITFEVGLPKNYVKAEVNIQSDRISSQDVKDYLKRHTPEFRANLKFNRIVDALDLLVERKQKAPEITRKLTEHIARIDDKSIAILQEYIKERPDAKLTAQHIQERETKIKDAVLTRKMGSLATTIAYDIEGTGSPLDNKETIQAQEISRYADINVKHMAKSQNFSESDTTKFKELLADAWENSKGFKDKAGIKEVYKSEFIGELTKNLVATAKAELKLSPHAEMTKTGPSAGVIIEPTLAQKLNEMANTPRIIQHNPYPQAVIDTLISPRLKENNKEKDQEPRLRINKDGDVEKVRSNVGGKFPTLDSNKSDLIRAAEQLRGTGTKDGEVGNQTAGAIKNNEVAIVLGEKIRIDGKTKPVPGIAPSGTAPENKDGDIVKESIKVGDKFLTIDSNKDDLLRAVEQLRVTDAKEGAIGKVTAEAITNPKVATPENYEFKLDGKLPELKVYDPAATNLPADARTNAQKAASKGATPE